MLGVNVEELKLELSSEEIEALKDFIHLGIQLGAGMNKNTGVLRKLLYGVLARVPENSKLYLGSRRENTEINAYVYITHAEKVENPPE